MIVFTHAAMLAHAPPGRHPERPDRLAAVLNALAEYPQREAPWAQRAWLARVHTHAHIDALERAFPESGVVALDPDTFVSPGSREASYRAAGALVAAVDAVLAGETETAFCAVRPPGHHAEPAQAMGFCLFNNIAIGALHALEAHGLSRVAVIDFDVHHGNGTQAAFQADDSLFLGSIHQSPLYPGTGAASETGVGNIVNAPVPPHAAREAWRAIFAGALTPALESFRPDLILISAGFDAHRRDPLAHQSLEADDFAWATRAVLEIARSCCGGKVVSSLEGGYDLEGLGRSAVAHVQALGEE